MTLSIEPSASTDAIVSRSPSAADWYADQLMDELFGDLERSLEEGVELLSPPPEPSPPIALQSVAVPPLVLPAEVLPPPPPKVQEPDPELIEAVADADRARQSVRLLDRLTIGAAALSLVATVGLWFLSRNAQTPLVTADAAAPGAADITSAAGGAVGDQRTDEFAAYMLRALDAIDRRNGGGPAAQLPKPAAIASIPPQLPNSTLTITGSGAATTAPPVPNSLPNSANPAAPGATNAPPAAASASLPVSSNLVEAIERLARLLERNPNLSAALPVNPPAARPAARTLPSPKPSASPTTDPSPAAAVPSYVLVGVLELADRSSALVAIDGVTRRVSLGESIGASGWTLVEVANQAATLRRNGETRSIFVGQQF